MSLKQSISDDIKTAMKAGEKARLQVLRMVLSEIKYAQAAPGVEGELDDATVLKVVAGYHKKLEKSLGDYPEGAQKTQILSEIAVVQHYLPKPQSREDMGKILDEVFKEQTERQMGPLMKASLAKLGQGADAKVLSEMIRARLANS